MSVQAVTWALAQKTGSPSGKAVLLALANYAGASGEAFPSVKRLADETEQSDDTVSRRLNELVAAGFIWKTGRYSNGAKGGRRSNEYVVLHDDAARARAAELGWTGATTSEDDDARDDIGTDSGSANCGLTYAANCGLSDEVNPQIDPPLTRNGAGSYEPKPRTQTLPPTPQGGIGGALRFEAFEAVWPFSPIESRPKARAAFEALVDEDRAMAVKWAARFIELHRERGRKHCDARTYLAEARFREFKPAAGQAVTASVVVWAGSPQAAAWDRYKREVEGDRRGLLFFSEKKAPDGCFRKFRVMPSEWPPSSAVERGGDGARDGPGQASG